MSPGGNHYFRPKYEIKNWFKTKKRTQIRFVVDVF